jgi:hypothetical protein
MNIPYVTTKAGILGLTDSLLGYLSPKGIKVSCLCPGGVTTDMAATARYIGTEEEKMDMKARDIEFHKSPFFSKPEQIADWLRRACSARLPYPGSANHGKHAAAAGKRHRQTERLPEEGHRRQEEREEAGNPVSAEHSIHRMVPRTRQPMDDNISRFTI